MARIGGVVFDIGNVLLRWDPEAFYDRVIGRERRTRLFAEVDLSGMNVRVDMGEDLAALVAETSRAHPAWADEIAMWHARWIEMAAPDIPETVAILRELRERRVPVFALSNFGTETFAVAEAQYAWLGEFDRRYISGHLGVMKPDPLIYRIVEADCGIAPERLLFTDDKAENVRAAEARGWQGHIFDGAAGLRTRLVAEGLITAEEARG